MITVMWNKGVYQISYFFKGEKIESSNLKNVLGNLGIEFADKELEEMLKILPIDGESYKCLCKLPGNLDFCGSACNFLISSKTW